MKKISFLYAIIFLGFLLFNSCCDPDYDPLTSEEVKWTPYALNQNLIFVNDSNIADTLIVSQYDKKDVEDHNGDGCNETFEEIDCRIKRTNDTTYLFYVFIHQGKIQLFAGDMDAVYNLDQDIFNIANCSANFNNNISINDSTYYNVIYLKDNQSDSNNVNELYFGKSIGIISYKDENGITWYKN
jgi:hypothetical protein